MSEDKIKPPFADTGGLIPTDIGMEHAKQLREQQEASKEGVKEGDNMLRLGWGVTEWAKTSGSMQNFSKPYLEQHLLENKGVKDTAGNSQQEFEEKDKHKDAIHKFSQPGDAGKTLEQMQRERKAEAEGRGDEVLRQNLQETTGKGSGIGYAQ
eukprot:GDKI01015981.1.p2 GENE.GDKI01015981.1~~GDKI01015981.1.p2  ORF type:complete len:153 (-),score=47.70 GDKI01015981.1:205-663(-)